jgi:hypothetical protein
MACSRVRRLGSSSMVVSLEVGTEDMIVVEEVAATIQDLDRISAVVMDRVGMDVEEVDMDSKVEMGMVSRVGMGMVSRVEMAMVSKVEMAMAMEVDMEGMEAVTLGADMVVDAVEVVEGDTRSERDEMTRREFILRFVEKQRD